MTTGGKELQEYRSTGAQEYRSSGVQEFRSTGVQESGVRSQESGVRSQESGVRSQAFLIHAIHTHQRDPVLCNC